LKENFNEKGRKEVQNTECDMYMLIPVQKLVLASRNILGERDNEERGGERHLKKTLLFSVLTRSMHMPFCCGTE